MNITEEWHNIMQTTTNWTQILDLWYHSHYTPHVDQLRILLQNLDKEHEQYYWIEQEFKGRGGVL